MNWIRKLLKKEYKLMMRTTTRLKLKGLTIGTKNKVVASIFIQKIIGSRISKK